MRLSHKSDYALRALIMLSRVSEERRPVTIREISQTEHIPEKFLVQIFWVLRKAGLLRSQMGMHGGYFLAKSPDQITFAEVIRILDGSWAPVFCVDKETPETCSEECHCGVRGVMMEVHHAVDSILSHTTLADACQGQRVAVS